MTTYRLDDRPDRPGSGNRFHLGRKRRAGLRWCMALIAATATIGLGVAYLVRHASAGPLPVARSFLDLIEHNDHAGVYALLDTEYQALLPRDRGIALLGELHAAVPRGGRIALAGQPDQYDRRRFHAVVECDGANPGGGPATYLIILRRQADGPWLVEFVHTYFGLFSRLQGASGEQRLLRLLLDRAGPQAARFRDWRGH